MTVEKISLSKTDISNVYIYVGDAVRWDYLPQRLRDRGVTAKTVASSIHSPTSFASIFSGRYLPQHQIQNFDDQLSSDSPHLFRSLPDSYHTGFANTINEKFVTSESSIIDKTLKINKVSQSELQDIPSPFIFVERGAGGHAPYGDHSLTAPEYFQKNVYDSSESYKRDYQASIKKDIDHFFKQVKIIKNRGLLDDTLIIYTSDHGELLGECGTLGHNSLIHPSLVYIPTVFIHPTLERGTQLEQRVFRHVDILPTIFSLLKLRIPNGVVGDDVLKTEFPVLAGSFYNYNSNIFGREFKSNYNSAWDYSGGFVYRGSSVFGSVLSLVSHYKGSKGRFMRKKPHENIRFFLRKQEIYGSPQFSEKQAKELIQNLRQAAAETEDAKEIDVDKNVLRDLGYLE